MSHKRKGQLTVSTEWWKHLKRKYWKAERRAEQRQIKKALIE